MAVAGVAAMTEAAPATLRLRHGRSGAVLVANLHDAVARRRRAAASDAHAAAVTTSLRMFHAYKRYEGHLRDGLPKAVAEEMTEHNAALYEAGYITRLWCLMHALVVDVPRLPGTAWLEFQRSLKMYDSHAEEAAVMLLSRRCCSDLPPVPQALLLDAAGAAMDPVAALFETVKMCTSAPADEAVQSQLATVAGYWCEFITVKGSAECMRDYIIALGRVASVSTLYKVLHLTHFFGAIRGAVPESPASALLNKLARTFSRLAEIMRGFEFHDPEASRSFAVWRSDVIGLYRNVYLAPEDGSASWHEQIRQHAQGDLEPLFEAVLHVLEFVYVEGALADDGCDWKDYLTMHLAYARPDASLDNIADLMAGEKSVFHLLRMTAEQVQALPGDDTLTILLLRGDVLDVITHLETAGCPGVAPHVLEVLAGMPDVRADMREKITALRDDMFTRYAAGLVAACRSEWRRALDYTMWTSGDAGRRVFIDIVETLDVDAAGIDHVLSLFTFWRSRDADAAVHKAILAFLARHGRALVERGLVVSGMRRLLQAEDLDSVADNLDRLITGWAVDVLKAPASDDGDEQHWIGCDLSSMASAPLLCLAEAFSRQSFEWPAGDAATRRPAVYLSKPPASLLDTLALTPKVAQLYDAYAARQSDGVRDAAVALLDDDAAPSLLKFAVLRLATPLLLDTHTCHFTKEAVGMMCRTMHRVLQEAQVYPRVRDGLAGTDVDTVRMAIVAAHSKAVCFSFALTATHDMPMQ